MKKAILLLLVCNLVLLGVTGCSNAGGAPSAPAERNDSLDTGHICINPIVTEYFSSFEEFLSGTAPKAEGEYSAAQLETLKSFYCLDAVPEGYVLYKIVADRTDIRFYYLPEYDTQSEQHIEYAENSLKHFLFISPRENYDFEKIMMFCYTSTENLIDGKYAVYEEEVQDIIFWQEDGKAVLLYVPYLMDYTDALPYCVTKKYVRNTETQTFEIEKEIQ